MKLGGHEFRHARTSVSGRLQSFAKVAVLAATTDRSPTEGHRRNVRSKTLMGTQEACLRRVRAPWNQPQTLG